MGNNDFSEIMKRGSTTFFNSALFFPAKIRKDVIILYAFVRTADDFVDSQPQNAQGFYDFRSQYNAVRNDKIVDDPIIMEFNSLANRNHFDWQWVELFLDAMQMDITKKIYQNISETEIYMHGSAATVGLMMSKIMGLPEESFIYAQLLGKAFQYINFIRDVREDIELGRTYLPLDEILNSGLPGLSIKSANEYQSEFENFIRSQIKRYYKWREEASQGFKYIPGRPLAAIKTASDIYDYTARTIENNPLIIMEKKVKPAKSRVFARGIINLLGVSN